MDMLHAPVFWLELGAIAWINLLVSGDNAVMIALAARSLPERQQKLAVFWGSAAAVALRIALTAFAGMLLGVAGGAIYALIRPWLPWGGWRRGLVFGLLLTMTFGAVMLDNGENPDYRRFGVPFLNVCLFNLLPVAFGLLVVPLAERLDRRLPAPPLAGSIWHRARGLATYAVLTLASLLVGVKFVFRTRLMLAAMTLDMFAVLLGGATFLLPMFAERLGVGPTGFGWLRAAPPIGAIVMAMLIAHSPPMKRAGRAMLISVASSPCLSRNLRLISSAALWDASASSGRPCSCSMLPRCRRVRPSLSQPPIRRSMASASRQASRASSTRPVF